MNFFNTIGMSFYQINNGLSAEQVSTIPLAKMEAYQGSTNLVSNFDRLPFRVRLTYTSINCTTIFILPSRLKQDVSQNGLTIKNFKLPSKWGLKTMNRTPFFELYDA